MFGEVLAEDMGIVEAIVALPKREPVASRPGAPMITQLTSPVPFALRSKAADVR